MSKDYSYYQILIIGNDVNEIEQVSVLIHDKIMNSGITVVESLQLAQTKLSFSKFDIILLLADSQEKISDILFSILTSTIEIPLILISDAIDNIDVQKSKITSRKNLVFDYLPKTDLNSLLLFKSITYLLDKNKQNTKYKTLKKRYRDLFQMNPLPMWIYDLEFLRFIQVNDAAVRKYGYSREEFMQMTLKDIRLPEDVVQLEKALDLVRKHENLFSNGIYRHLKKDGSLIYAEVVSNIIYIDKLKYELVLANDITESINHIQAIESQNAKLQEIAFTHSHIIRPPLANMMGILNLVRDMDLNSPESTELLDHLFTSCKQLDEKIAEVVRKSASYPLPDFKP